MADRESIVERVEKIAQRVAASRGLEIVEVRLLGGGAHRVLKIFIDKDPDGTIHPLVGAVPMEADGEASEAETSGEALLEPGMADGEGSEEIAADVAAPEGIRPGVTLGDCEYVSHQLGTILDVEDVIPGARYALEVSSPGVERKLSRPRDFERFVGEKIKVTLTEPVEKQRSWTGLLSQFQDGMITLEPKPGKTLSFPLEQVEKANLKFEW